MKKRHPAAVLLLPIVTLGIYCIYWLYATRKELLQASGNKKDSIPPVFLLFLPFILLIGLAFAALIATDPTTGSTASTQDSSLVAGIVTGIIVAGFFIGGVLLLPLWWFWKYCKVAAQVIKDKGGMDFTQLYVLYVAIVWLCGIVPVWMLIAQLDFNKTVGQPQPAHTPHKHPHATAA